MNIRIYEASEVVPPKSCEVLVWTERSPNAYLVGYSKKYGGFNAHDFGDGGSIFDDVVYWAYVPSKKSVDEEMSK